MQLPLPTTIPLNVLNDNVGDFLCLSVATTNCLSNNGIDRMWQLLMRVNSQLRNIKNMGEVRRDEIRDALHDKQLRLGELTEYYYFLHGDLSHEYANMTIDELFVYVPTERPPLTEEQMEFLCKWPNDAFTNMDELQWCYTFSHMKARQDVFNIALLLPHIRHDDKDKDVIARIRARIEYEVGPLPLALSSDELCRFFR